MNNSHSSLEEKLRADGLIALLGAQTFCGDLYLVGGALREILLGNNPVDYDLAITAHEDIDRIEALFGRSSFILGKKPIQAHRIVALDISLDITVIETNIDEDLKRRDLTINAIGYDIKKGKVIDLLGGIEDIRRKLIRYPSRTSFIDDPLRMLKSLRHLSTLEGFTMEEELLQSVRELRHLIHEVAAERIKYELDQIIVSRNVAETLKTMDETGLLFELFPELLALRRMDVEKGFLLQTLGHTLDGFKFFHSCNEFTELSQKALRDIGYAFLFHDLGKAHTFSFDEKKKAVHFFHHERYSRQIAASIMERLRFSIHEMRSIMALIESHMRIFLISNTETTEKAIRRIVYKMGDLTPSLVLHTLCDMYGSSGGTENSTTIVVKDRCRKIMDAYEISLREPLPKLLSGDDLLEIGFIQGPIIGQCLKDIRDKQIAGELTDTKEAILYATSFLADNLITEMKESS